MRILIIIMFLSSVLVTMFQSCGRIADDTKPSCCIKPHLPSDPAFSLYTQEFEFYSQLNTDDTPIYFAELEGKTAGVCHYFRIGGGPIRWGYIEIDKSYWGVITEYQKMNLIFHELGHCVLGLDHVPWDNSVESCPSSFMHDTILSNYCIEKNYIAYIQEMFPLWKQ